MEETAPAAGPCHKGVPGLFASAEGFKSGMDASDELSCSKAFLAAHTQALPAVCGVYSKGVSMPVVTSIPVTC